MESGEGSGVRDGAGKWVAWLAARMAMEMEAGLEEEILY